MPNNFYQVMIQAVNVLAMLFQGYCLQNLYASFLEAKSGRSRQIGCTTAVCWAAAKLAMGYAAPSGYDSIWAFARLLLLTGLLLLLAICLYHGTIALKLYLSITFMTFTEISFFLAYMILILGNHIFSLWTWCIQRGYLTSSSAAQAIFQITSFVLQALVYLGLSLLTCLLIKMLKKRYQKKDYIMQKTELLFILTPSLAGLFICIFLRMIIITTEQGVFVLLYDRYPLLSVVVPAILISSLLSVIYAVKLFQDMIVLNQEKQNRMIMEQQVRGLQEHISEMERVHAGIRGMRHDIKNQMSLVMQLVGQVKETEEISAEWNGYLAELNQRIDGLEIQFKTGNTVADAILNMKFHEAKRRMEDIKIEADALIFPKDLKIQSYDLAVILCNALDNAIEACEKLEPEAKKFIYISSFQRGNMFFLEFENSFSGQIGRKKGAEFPMTEKKDKEFHGIGFYNMKASAEKYYGGLEWEIKEKVFFLTVMMENKEADISSELFTDTL